MHVLHERGHMSTSSCDAALRFQPHYNLTAHTPHLAPRIATTQFTNHDSNSPPDTHTAEYLRSATNPPSITDTTEKRCAFRSTSLQSHSAHYELCAT